MIDTTAPTFFATQSAPLTEAGGINNALGGNSTSTSLISTDGTISTEGWSAAGGSTYTKAGTYGTVTLNTSTNVITYALDNTATATQNLNQFQIATELFQVTTQDAAGNATTQSLVFSIIGNNDAPVITAGAQSAAIVEAGANGAGTNSATVALALTDADGTTPIYDNTFLTLFGWATSDTITYTKSGTYGSASLNTTTGVVTYTLNNADADTQALSAGASASDNFNITVNDGLTTTTRQVSFAITGSNDAPTSQNVSVAVTENGSRAFALSDFTFTDVDSGDSLASVRIVTLPATGTITLSGNAVSANQIVSADDITAGLLIYTPALNSEATQNFAFTVLDSNGAESAATKTFTLTINAINTVPTVSFVGATASGFTILATDLDSSDVLTLVSAVSGSSAVNNGTNTTFTVSPDVSDTNVDLAVTDGEVSVPVLIDGNNTVVYIGTEGDNTPGAVNAGESVIMYGFGGNDVLTGGTGKDYLFGGAGNDTISTGGGADVIDAGSGTDTLQFTRSLLAAATVDGGADSDTVVITAASTSIVDADFTNFSNVEVLQLTGASTAVLSAEAKAAGFTTIVTGDGDTDLTITDPGSGFPVTIDASAMTAEDTLTIRGTGSITISGLVAQLTSSATGPLTISTTAAATQTIRFEASPNGTLTLGGAESIQLATAVDLSGLAITGVGSYTLTLDSNAAVSMTVAQHNAATAINAAGTTDQITLTTAGTLTGDPDVETYNLATAGGSTFTLGAASQNVTTGTGGADTLNV
ncbi:VCBS domain-containing protein, partial [Synechococcus sp. FGCU-3]|nr:VCBS domain-containing protein [Synechococcus sp. FGCU3]